MMTGRLIQITFLLIPYAYLSYGIVHRGHQFGLILAAIIIAASQVRNIYAKLFVWYVALWQIILFLVFMSKSQQIPMISLAMFLKIFFANVIFLAVRDCKITKESFYDIICIATVTQMVIGFLQYIDLRPVVFLLNLVTTAKALEPLGSVTGTLGNENFYTAFLAISLPFFFRRKWIYFVPVIVFFLYVIHTSTAVVAALVGLGYYFLRDYSWKKICILALIPLICIFYYTYFIDSCVYTNIRWEWWYGLLKKIFAEPLPAIFGFGTHANWGHNYPIHNDWLEILFKWGIVGLGLLIGAFFKFYTRNKILMTALIIACVNALGNYPFHLPPSVFLIVIILGLLEREKYVRLSNIQKSSG